jgi:hypothetical protein
MSSTNNNALTLQVVERFMHYNHIWLDIIWENKSSAMSFKLSFKGVC